jgi:hypothetical protein
MNITVFWIQKGYTASVDHSGRAVYSINVFPRSNTGIVSSNPTQGMDGCLLFFRVCVLLLVAALRRADYPSKKSY